MSNDDIRREAENILAGEEGDYSRAYDFIENTDVSSLPSETVDKLVERADVFADHTVNSVFVAVYPHCGEETKAKLAKSVGENVDIDDMASIISDTQDAKVKSAIIDAWLANDPDDDEVGDVLVMAGSSLSDETVLKIVRDRQK